MQIILSLPRTVFCLWNRVVFGHLAVFENCVKSRVGLISPQKTSKSFNFDATILSLVQIVVFGHSRVFEIGWTQRGSDFASKNFQKSFIFDTQNFVLANRCFPPLKLCLCCGVMKVFENCVNSWKCLFSAKNSVFFAKFLVIFKNCLYSFCSCSLKFMRITKLYPSNFMFRPLVGG